MAKPIKIIEVRSELGAGTRGASLGIDAIRKAALSQNNKLLDKFLKREVKVQNEVLRTEIKFVHAKYIDRISDVLENVSEAVAEEIKEKVLEDSFEAPKPKPQFTGRKLRL